MTIDIQLSQRSINNAISELKKVKENLNHGLQQTIDILVKEGAEQAQSSFGSMANVTGYMPDETTGIISASGEAAIIAEFGAGDATTEVMFENSPGVPVYPGSYSELVGSGEYAESKAKTGQGRWHFGGRVYTEIPPRAGMLNAKTFIMRNAATYAKGVIKL